MESEPVRRRVVKRSSNACTRCRRQKIKCSGLQPCQGCSKRNLSCRFDERDQKILVTRGYLIDLQKRIASLERGDSGYNNLLNRDDAGKNEERMVGNAAGGEVGRDVERAPESAPQPASHPPHNAQDLDAHEPDPRQNIGVVSSALTNPLTTGPSTYMATENGRSYYLGTSSNWSFTLRVLKITHEHVCQAPLPTGSLLFDSFAYDLGWDGLRTSPNLETPALPTLDYAIYLINAVKFRCGQMFHLFEEDSFMTCLYEFYSDSSKRLKSTGLWYIHFLLILAFGKAFVLPKNQGKMPSGGDFFLKALQLLPDDTVLCKEPVVSAEILCCISLYLHSLDFRLPAYNYIGQAMRIALAQGMHTDMPVHHLGEAFVHRCRKIWWTTYILDREMTSLMGLPQSIHDEDVQTQPPSLGSGQRNAAMHMHIKLSQIIASINRTIYGIDGRLNRNFLLSTKAALASIANLTDELSKSLPLYYDKNFQGISRVSAHLHLLYHQCIVLATRPLLFCFLRIRFETPDTCLESLNSSQSARGLIQMCIESSIKMVNILDSLKVQDLLETLLPFDLDSVSMSAVILLVGPVIDPSLLECHSSSLAKAYAILEEIIMGGNLIAEFRRSELQLLNELLKSTSTSRDHVQLLQETVNLPRSANLDDLTLSAQTFDQEGLIPPNHDCLDERIINIEMSTAQVMALVDSIADGDTEWMSQAIDEHSIW